MAKEKAVVSMSGGLDSSTLLYKVIADGYQPLVVTFSYGQRHGRELQSARKICRKLGLKHEVVNMKPVGKLLSSSSLTNASIKVPEGHYAKATMAATVVPSRNSIFLSVASGYAVSQKAAKVYFGAHAGDSYVYPDCRPEYVAAFNEMLKLANEQPCEVVGPFLSMSKAQIVTLGLELGVPYQLAWSCYKGGTRPCLKCGTCVERTEAFLLANAQDPLLTDAEWKKAENLFNKYKAEYEDSQRK